jgi:hypothetical protein
MSEISATEIELGKVSLEELRKNHILLISKAAIHIRQENNL